MLSANRVNALIRSKPERALIEQAESSGDSEACVSSVAVATIGLPFVRVAARERRQK